MERVRVAIVEPSQCSIEKLRYMLACAKIDYRDVLAWKQLGPLSPEQGEKLTKDVREMLGKWGKKSR